MRGHNYFVYVTVYVTTNPGRTVLYTGVTNNLAIRLRQHYENRGRKETFAGRYYCYKLIYYESFPKIHQAIEREKEIKDLSRASKNLLINSQNPGWKFYDICE